MANVFNSQDLFLDELRFAWPRETAILDCVTFDPSVQKKFEPTNHAGSHINLRRPSWIQGLVDPNTTGAVPPNPQNTTQDFYDESLADGVMVTPTGFQSLQQASLQIVLSHTVRADVEVSAQRLTQTLTREQIREEFVEPMMTSAVENLQQALIADIDAYTGNAVVANPSYTNYAQLLQNVTGAGASVMRSRKGIGQIHQGYLLTNPDALYNFGTGAATNYHIGENPESIQDKGEWGGRKINGFRPITSPLIGSKAIPAQWSGVTVAAAAGGVTNGLTAWGATFQVLLQGLPNNAVLPRGLKIYFVSGGSVNVNWVIPTTKANTGKVATFSLVNSVTASGTGTATVTLSGPLVYAGPSRNVSITTALDGYSAFIVGATVGASTQTPAYLINPKAVVGAMQHYDIPVGTPWFKHITTKNGARFSLFLDRWPTTGQSVLSLRGYFGAAVVAEEGTSIAYGV